MLLLIITKLRRKESIDVFNYKYIIQEYMKKIIVYVDSMKPAGGKERVVANLIREWINSYEIVLITKDEGESFYLLPNVVRKVSLGLPMRLNMKNRFQRILSVFCSFFKCKKSLKKVLDGMQFDYIYTTTPLNSLEAYTLGRLIRKKLVISEHASCYAYNRIYTIIKKLIYPKVYCISVPNRMDVDIYNKWGCNTYYIPHLVTYKDKKRSSLNNKIVLNVGRLTEDKRQDKLLTIWSRIKEKKGWELWIVGDGEEKDNLSGLIKTLKIEKSVKLLPANKEIEKIYEQSSVFALTSRCEGFGMVLIEAMAFGVPCIAYDCPSGPRDIIQNGSNGYLIPDNFDNEYTNKLQELLINHEELVELGNGAYKTINDWDNKQILNEWKKLFF